MITAKRRLASNNFIYNDYSVNKAWPQLLVKADLCCLMRAVFHPWSSGLNVRRAHLWLKGEAQRTRLDKSKKKISDFLTEGDKTSLVRKSNVVDTEMDDQAEEWMQYSPANVVNCH